jgi:hypothetical protein
MGPNGIPSEVPDTWCHHPAEPLDIAADLDRIRRTADFYRGSTCQGVGV